MGRLIYESAARGSSHDTSHSRRRSTDTVNGDLNGRDSNCRLRSGCTILAFRDVHQLVDGRGYCPYRIQRRARLRGQRCAGYCTVRSGRRCTRPGDDSAPTSKAIAGRSARMGSGGQTFRSRRCTTYSSKEGCHSSLRAGSCGLRSVPGMTTPGLWYGTCLSRRRCPRCCRRRQPGKRLEKLPATCIRSGRPLSQLQRQSDLVQWPGRRRGQRTPQVTVSEGTSYLHRDGKPQWARETASVHL